MDLTFQVPMQYFSLQHWTLLSSPITSTTGCCFCFVSVSSFFLRLFLHWSSVAYWVPITWWVHLSVVYFFAFSYCSWGCKGKNTEVVCHSLLQWTLLKLLWTLYDYILIIWTLLKVLKHRNLKWVDLRIVPPPFQNDYFQKHQFIYFSQLMN